MLLANYCSLFFDTVVQLLPDFELAPDDARRRINGFTGQKQRYAKLAKFYEPQKLDSAAAFARKRVRKILVEAF